MCSTEAVLWSDLNLNRYILYTKEVFLNILHLQPA